MTTCQYQDPETDEICGVEDTLSVGMRVDPEKVTEPGYRPTSST